MFFMLHVVKVQKSRLLAVVTNECKGFSPLLACSFSLQPAEILFVKRFHVQIHFASFIIIYLACYRCITLITAVKILTLRMHFIHISCKQQFYYYSLLITTLGQLNLGGMSTLLNRHLPLLNCLGYLLLIELVLEFTVYCLMLNCLQLLFYLLNVLMICKKNKRLMHSWRLILVIC